MRLLTATLLVFATITASAKTLFVSDIDDTIKISYVLDTSDKIKNAVKIQNQFYGMAHLYRAYQASDPTAQFAYLSAAPRSLMKKPHELFLGIHQFAKGELLLREHLSDHNFKINSIRKLIETHKPEKVILVGDNGERDPMIYAQAQAEYPSIPIHIYIHQAYSFRNHRETGVEPLPNQIQFVTAIEIARSFLLKGFLTQAAFSNLSLAIVPKIVRQSGDENSGSRAIPGWVDCRDHFGIVQLERSRWHLSPSLRLNTKRPLSEWLDAYDAKIKARCLNGPIND